MCTKVAPPSASFRIKTAKIGPNLTKQARFCDTGLRKLNPPLVVAVVTKMSYGWIP